MTEIAVNGSSRQVGDDTSIADLVRDLAGNARGCAVAVNDEVIPRPEWATRTLHPSDRVEVVTAVQGG